MQSSDLMGATVHLRPVGDCDWPFLYRVYASTRAEELARTDWTPADKQTFLRMQFEAQRRYYSEHFADAAFQIVEIDGQPAGRLYLDRRADELRIIDIALLPEFRGAGVGGQLMRDILDEGLRANLQVRIHVEHENPAMRLYERIGFQRIEQQGVYYLMEWTPPGHQS